MRRAKTTLSVIQWMDGTLSRGIKMASKVSSGLSKHRGDGKVKLGRGPYTISMAILSMHAGFQHPRTKYMIAPNILLFLHVFFHVVLQISVE